MSSILLINAAGRETRVALVENGHIAEFYLERKKDKGVVGNIYKGRVTRVLPGMQAAFVDIGLEKAAFLYVSDVFYDPEFSRYHFELTEGEHGEAPEMPELPEGAEAAEEGGSEVADVPVIPDLAAAPDLHPEEGGHHDAEFEMHEVASPVPPPSAPATGAVLATAEAAPAATPSSAGFGEPQPGEFKVANLVDAELANLDVVPSGAQVIEKAVQEAQAQAQDARALQRHKELKQRRREEKQRKPARIEELLKVGQEVVVQISKDPIGTKGARLTSHISIPGRHLVFMPTVDHIGISRRIGNEKERRRLRDTVERLRPPGSGFIVRTVAENVPQEKLEADIRFLIEVWNETLRKNEKIHNRAGLLHPDLDLILRATRDLFAADVEQLVIDDRDEYERVLQFVTAQDPALKDRVKLHDSEEPILDAYGVEEEIKRATQRKVWLKSGGYLIIDQAEALVAIDVNSGRYVGKKSLEETITKINVEAAKEIVYQLRLRNIGGIIICDFIDMEKQQNRDKVFKSLQEALGRDKAKTNVLRISELGLVEMTRKRVRESIGRMLHEDCAYCEGQGFVKTSTTVAYEIFREIRRSAGTYKDPTLAVNCSVDVANLLLGEEKAELRHLMDRFNKSIQVKAMPDFHREQYDIFVRPVAGNEFKVASSGDYAPVHYGNVKHRPPENSRDQRRDRRDRGGDRGDRERGGGGGGGGDRDRGGREGKDNREARGDRGDRGDRNSRRDRDRDRGNRQNQNGGGNNGNGGQRNGGGDERAPDPAPSAPAPSEG